MQVLKQSKKPTAKTAKAIQTNQLFFSSSNIDEDKRKSRDMMQKIHGTFGDVFNDIGCFEGTFSLQLKPNSKPYQVPPRHVAYVLQQPFKEELECLQKMDNITLLGVDEIAFCWYPKQMVRFGYVWTWHG